MDIKQIRLSNLKTAIDIAGGASVLADKADTNPSYLSQILSTKHPATVGGNLARKIEKAINKEEGWMDTDHLSFVDFEDWKKQEQRFIEKVRKMTKEQKEDLLTIIDLMNKKQSILDKYL